MRLLPVFLLLLILLTAAGAQTAGDRLSATEIERLLRDGDTIGKLRGLRALRLLRDPPAGLIERAVDLAINDPDELVRQPALDHLRRAPLDRRIEAVRAGLGKERVPRILHKLVRQARAAQTRCLDGGRTPAFTDPDVPALLRLALRELQRDHRHRPAELRKDLFRLLATIAPADVAPRMHFEAFERRLGELVEIPDVTDEALAAGWREIVTRGAYRSEDVPALTEALFDSTRDKMARAGALAALGWVHDEAAVAALDRHRATLCAARPYPDGFTDAERDHPSTFHFGPSRIRPLATGKDAGGRTWGVFLSVLLDGMRLSFAVSTGEGKWSREIVTDHVPDRKGGHQGQADRLLRTLLASEPAVREMDLRRWRQDTDGDGLPDLVEKLLGLDPKAADSDGDGNPDGRDPFPDAAARPEGLEGAIRQAAWDAVLGTTRGPGHLVIMGQRAGPRCEYRGYPGPVVWTNETVRRERGHTSVMILTDFVVERSGNRAKVRIADYEAPEAAGSAVVHLRRFGDRWFVTGIVRGPVA